MVEGDGKELLVRPLDDVLIPTGIGEADFHAELEAVMHAVENSAREDNEDEDLKGALGREGGQG